MVRLFILLLTISIHAVADEICNEERAFKLGMEAISKEFPNFYQSKSPYELVDFEENWAVVGFTAENMRGGGAPEAIIDRKTCEVIHVYLAR